MIDAQEARTIILNSVQPLGHVSVSLVRSLDSVLAEDIVAGENIPPFDNAAMDGYAVRAEDVRSAPCLLKIVGEIPAGSVASKGLNPGEAMSIMTGAKIPDGSDAVIQQEWTEGVDGIEVKIMRPAEKGHNVRPAGADIRRETGALKGGQRARPQEIGVLASLGKQCLEIYRYPTVAI